MGVGARQPRPSSPGRGASPGRQPRIGHMHMPIGMHVYPDPVAPMRFSARPAARAWVARGQSVTESDGRVMRCERSGEKRRLWIQKRPGVQRRQASRFLAHCLTWRQEAANHHEFRLSVQSMAGSPHRQALRRRVPRVAAAARLPFRTPIRAVDAACASRGRPWAGVHFAHRRHPVIPCPTTHSLYSITR